MRIVHMAAAALVLLLLAWAGAGGLAQPAGEPTPYRLPWLPGEAHVCVQGNDGWVSHHGWQRHAFDFAMPVGTTVTAARAGVVVRVVDHHDGRGRRAPNNLVAIRHDDGTIGWYLHIRKGGALVRPGERVAQGQPIAHSGNVGRSLMPHLHFHVTDAARRRTLPVRFADVDGDGVPRTFGRYRAAAR